MIQSDVFAFIPPWLLSGLHWVAGLIVFAEALNKLERTAPLAPGLSRPARIAAWLKFAAWLLLSAGGAGALITPLLHLERPTLQDVATLLGFAVLIIRTRFKEG